MTEQEQQHRTRGAVDRLAPPAPARLGQATAVEQSRAQAEVVMSVELALRAPRDPSRALAAMREVTDLYRMSERAFWSYRRSGSNLTGSTIHLLRELARVWGNVSYGIAELDRDDAHGQSQMIAFAWDLETNVRASTAFIVPHVRDTKDGAKPITDIRDVYENNANMGARRVREQIAAVLPRWFVDEAEARCRATLAAGPDKGATPLPVRITAAVEAFESGYRVRREQLVEHVGRPVAEWSPVDLANVGILYRSLQNGEARVDDVFSPDVLVAGAIREQAAASKARRRSPSLDAAARRDGRGPAAAQPAAGDAGAGGDVSESSRLDERPPDEVTHYPNDGHPQCASPPDDDDPTTDPGFGTDEARP